MYLKAELNSLKYRILLEKSVSCWSYLFMA